LASNWRDVAALADWWDGTGPVIGRFRLDGGRVFVALA
jgi:hypothetical protein